ncbi:hypothetical protein JOD54_004275 [Actinokineospora baliensis]|uniref:CHAT domain-containing protein n=1 Tax=Actinokineospora baliensis TaxID=547056 RepID=UPI001957FF4E|nr:CHAT domain-containing protein [Actinokineospora baliensis]MBM7774071.1 hypothetical protein [Actinokineospora baliensis]
MGLFKKRKSLDDRYLELRALAEEAQNNEAPNAWNHVQELGWQLIKDCMARVHSADPLVPVIIVAITKITLRIELAAQDWHRVTTLGMAEAAAVAVIDQRHEAAPNPRLIEAIAMDLYRNAEVIAHAAHRAGVPTAACTIGEELTSIRLGDRTLARSTTSWVDRSTPEEQRSGLRVINERVRAERKRARRPLKFDGPPNELDSFYQQQMRSAFAEIDPARSGPRVAMAFGAGIPLEAMRQSDRSLLYVGAGVHGGMAIAVDSAALDDPGTPIASSTELPGFDVVAVENKVAALHRFAAGRRDREISGTVLSEHIEDLLAWLGETVWRPVLDRWPELRERPIAVIPLGESAQLPLFTAVLDDRPVCGFLDLAVTPSARSLILAAEHPPATGAAFVAADPSTGDDELIYVADEARAVAAVHGVEPLVISEPTGPPDDQRLRSAGPRTHSAGDIPTDLLDRVRRSAVVHLACHGVIKSREPLASALLLGGTLPLSSLLAVDLLAGSTIVLSACDLAGIGTAVPGEQLGFPAVLLACGARSVVAALWPVPDAPRTVRLMTRFHERLASAQAHRALGTAIEEAREAGAPASLWAPFTYFGA